MDSHLEMLAEVLLSARRVGQPVERFTKQMDLSLSDAYAVQQLVVSGLLTDGADIVGLKLGFTSLAKAREMGIDEPIAGVLTDRMNVPGGSGLAMESLINPRVEPEIAFKVDLAQGGSSVVQLAPALEIIDSRFRDFDFEVLDVVADNASASHFALGEWREISQADLENLSTATVSISEEGKLQEEAPGAAILGHPKHAIRAAVKLAEMHGFRMEGQIILLAGAATRAIPLRPGNTYTAAVEGYGAVTIRAERTK